MNELTNNAEYPLNSMYTQYLDRRKDNISKREARNFQNIGFIKESTVLKWSKEDILDTYFELQHHECISVMSGDNALFFIHLTTETIVALELELKEPTLKEGIESVLDLAAKVETAIPFP